MLTHICFQNTVVALGELLAIVQLYVKSKWNPCPSIMSAVATPTLLSREPKFPHCLPKPPQPHPMPLSPRHVYGHLNAVRDLQREMDDLSDEENELEDLVRSRIHVLSPMHY